MSPTRFFLVLAVSAGCLFGPALARADDRRGCLATPAQTEGPFYPVLPQDDKDNDLTVIKGQTHRADGAVLYVSGHVLDRDCHPVAGAVVEIWQGAASGRYRHPDDDNPAPDDPHFQHWGVATTDATGRYEFKTIKPAPYPAGMLWTRPGHIHVKVYVQGRLALTTQLYFAGDPYLKADRIFRRIPENERPRVVAALEPVAGAEPAAQRCRFDLVLP